MTLSGICNCTPPRCKKNGHRQRTRQQQPMLRNDSEYYLARLHYSTQQPPMYRPAVIHPYCHTDEYRYETCPIIRK
jgi:hypothetical protein